MYHYYYCAKTINCSYMQRVKCLEKTLLFDARKVSSLNIIRCITVGRCLICHDSKIVQGSS